MLLEYNKFKKTCVIINASQKKIKKIFFLKKNSDSKINFKNEIAGNKWYFRKLQIKNISKKFHNINYSSNYITLPYYQGYQLKFWKSIRYSSKIIDEVLRHYIKVWPVKKKVAYHGDLSLSNIIFFRDKKKLRIIDWENFKKNECWGLDICYFLLSLLILPSLGRKKITIHPNEIKLFSYYWRSFFKNKKYKYLSDPINYLKKKKKNI